MTVTTYELLLFSLEVANRRVKIDGAVDEQTSRPVQLHNAALLRGRIEQCLV
jgi:hypothetical protein